MARKKRPRRASEEGAARAVEKRARREERKRQEQETRARRRRRRRLRDGAIAAVALAVVGAVVFQLVKPQPEVAGVEKPRDLDNNHVPAGTPVDYGTAVPTSGDHYANEVAGCGPSGEQPPLPAAVHAMEHGAVVLWYRPDVEEQVRPKLVDVMDRYESHVIVAPNPGIEEPVVATAWNRRMRFDDADEPRIGEFVDTYRKRGPERVRCPI